MVSTRRRTTALSICLDIELEGLSDAWDVRSEDVAAVLYADLRRAHPAVRAATDAVLELVHLGALMPGPGSGDDRRRRTWGALTLTPIGSAVRQAVRGLALARLAGGREAGNG